MKFLNQYFLDNTILSYLIVAGVILLAFILKRLISKLMTTFLFKMGNAQWRGMSKEQFDEFIITPLERFFMVLVVLFLLSGLNFPEALKFSIHKVSIIRILGGLASGLVIVCTVSLILRFMDFIILVIKNRSHGTSASEHQVLFFFKDFIRVVIIIFSIAFILKFSFGINISNLLTGLSIVGAALALSARESLENLIASFVIFFDKPFETGDTVKVKEFVGKVERIGLRSTRIRTFDRSMVAVPNKQMVDNILDNWSKRNFAKNEIRIVLPAWLSANDIEGELAFIHEVLSAEKKVESFTAFLEDINAGVATILITYYTPLNFTAAEVGALKQDINLKIKKKQEDFTEALPHTENKDSLNS